MISFVFFTLVCTFALGATLLSARPVLWYYLHLASCAPLVVALGFEGGVAHASACLFSYFMLDIVWALNQSGIARAVSVFPLIPFLVNAFENDAIVFLPATIGAAHHLVSLFFVQWDRSVPKNLFVLAYAAFVAHCTNLLLGQRFLSEANARVDLTLAGDVVGSIMPKYLYMSVEGITAVFQAVYTLRHLRTFLQRREFTMQTHTLRWVEYAITATLRSWAFSVSIGIRGVETTVYLVASGVTLQLLGAVYERSVSTGHTQQSIFVIATCALWLPPTVLSLAMLIVDTARRVEWWYFFLYSVMYASFPFVAYWWSRTSQFWRIEAMYQILSVTSKTGLFLVSSCTLVDDETVAFSVGCIAAVVGITSIVFLIV